MFVSAGFISLLMIPGSVVSSSIISEVIIVDDYGQGDYRKIQDAINNSASGGTIRVWSGIYYESLLIDKRIELIGNSTSDTVIESKRIEWYGDIVQILADDVVIDKFTITGVVSNWMRAGIRLCGANKCRIENIDCLNIEKGSGIRLQNSNNNIINDNTCNNNSFTGIWLAYSSQNSIKDNTCNYNKYSGIYVSDDAWLNVFENNIASNNRDGIFLFGSPNSVQKNIFIENEISDNWVGGITIENGYNNRFYHNKIISNTYQINETGDNFWDDGNGEGNYWSDYAGLDNGFNSRALGDGIGDTHLPHNEVDNYPFINYLGWLDLKPPTLNDPGKLNNDGNFTIDWSTSFRATEYILEEDNDNSFHTPMKIYNGSDLNYTIFDRKDDYYYYRIKARNNYTQSKWSNIEYIEVDRKPKAPSNLTITQINGHEHLTLNQILKDITY